MLKDLIFLAREDSCLRSTKRLRLKVSSPYQDGLLDRTGAATNPY